MFRFLCFPATVDGMTLKSRDAAQIVEAVNHCAAVNQACNITPLFEGEQMAVVLIGRVLNESAASKVNFGQAT